MRKLVFATLAIIFLGSQAFAVPPIQLFISGATYDWEEQSWIIAGSSFDLYVVSANTTRDDIIVSIALSPYDNPANTEVNFAGNDIGLSDWRFGYAPIDNAWWRWNGGEDLPWHNIYPTWFSEVHTGAYGLGSTVGDVQPDASGNFWNPATNDGASDAQGQVKVFHVETGGVYSFVHFDAYTLNSDNEIEEFAPFSHDAGAIPEPGTIALMGTGLFGIIAAYRRKKS